MAENLTKKPKRGILKQSTSFEHHGDESTPKCMKEPHFDESNILATLHPVDKDYGFMKIEEPKTPYEAYDSEDEGGKDELDATLLAARIAAEGHKAPSRTRRASEPSGDEEDLKLLSPEDREKRDKFESKRKAHYNEFYAVKMARQLLNEGEDEEEDSKADVDTPDEEDFAAQTSTSQGEGGGSPELKPIPMEISGGEC